MFYALDTNIISYFLKGDITIIRKMEEEMRKGNDFVIPPIVYFEIQCHLTNNNLRYFIYLKSLVFLLEH